MYICETLEILVEDLSWHNEEYLWFPEVSVYLSPFKNYISIIIIIRNCLASIEMFGSASIIEPTVFSFKFGYWHRPCCHILFYLMSCARYALKVLFFLLIGREISLFFRQIAKCIKSFTLIPPCIIF